MSCQHGQSQRQCPLCERDDTIAELRQRVNELTDTLSRTDEQWKQGQLAMDERDALRAEVERLSGHVNRLTNLIELYRAHRCPIGYVEIEALRARLAAAEKFTSELVTVGKAIRDEENVCDANYREFDALIAAHDAAKGGTTNG